MNTQENENLQRAGVLVVLLVSVIKIAVLPSGIEGSVYLLSVAAFSGVMAALVFIGNSAKQIKSIAEQMSDDYQTDAKSLSQAE